MQTYGQGLLGLFVSVSLLCIDPFSKHLMPTEVCLTLVASAASVTGMRLAA